MGKIRENAGWGIEKFARSLSNQSIHEYHHTLIIIISIRLPIYWGKGASFTVMEKLVSRDLFLLYFLNFYFLTSRKKFKFYQAHTCKNFVEIKDENIFRGSQK